MTIRTYRRVLTLLCAAVVLLGPGAVAAAEALVGVAANFARPADALALAFAARGEHRVRMVVGSSGKLFAQIANGAPVHVFLSADQERPGRLVAAGLADGTSRFTYAVGGLTLFGRGGIFMAVLFGSLAFSSYQALQRMGGGGSGGRPW